jgi:hypothetical protein
VIFSWEREQVRVTEVSVHISRGGGPDLLEFYNGLSGPATDLICRVRDALQGPLRGPWWSRKVKGSWDGAVLKAHCKGAVLRELLAGLDTSGGRTPSDLRVRGHKSADASTLAEFVNGLDDATWYAISGFDV